MTDSTIHGWTNFGDVSPDHGQTWISGDSRDDFANVVEVIAGPDLGMPENSYHIGRGVIYFSPDNWDRALECCDSGIYGPPTFYDVAYAFNAYQGYDQDSYGGVEIVLVGKRKDLNGFDSDFDRDPDTILHGNTKISNYIEGNFLA